MKRSIIRCALCALVSILLIMIPDISGGQWSEPYLVNQLVTGISQPVFSPGERANLTFVVSNPFPQTISDVKILAQPYLLVYADLSNDWSNLTDPPLLTNATAVSSIITITSLAPGENRTVEYSIATTPSTSRGGLFDQSVYLVRITLSFEVANQVISYASRGFFSAEQWENLTMLGGQDSTGFNMTYLGEMGYSGILPDMSFIVRDEIPIWPAVAIILLASLTGTMATYYHLKGDPMAAPRVYQILVKARRVLIRIAHFRRKV